MDSIERLLDYVAIGPRFSNVVLQTLIVLLKKNMKKGKRLLVIGTSSLPSSVLESFGLLSCFNTVINVPRVRDVEALTKIAQNRIDYNEDHISALQNAPFGNINVTVKKLINLVELANEAEDTDFVDNLVSLVNNQ